MRNAPLLLVGRPTALYPRERDRYKQIAAELRVLVGDHRPARRLLLALMDECQFMYYVEPGPPLYWPIPMVGWETDPEQMAIRAEIAAAGDDPERREAALAKERALARPVPFHDYVERGLAVFINPHEYSHRDLILAVSQQIGSGHEDETMEEPLVQLGQFIIGGHEGHIAPMIAFADRVLDVGAQFISHVAIDKGYEPRYFKAAG